MHESDWSEVRSSVSERLRVLLACLANPDEVQRLAEEMDKKAAGEAAEQTARRQAQLLQSQQAAAAAAAAAAAQLKVSNISWVTDGQTSIAMSANWERFAVIKDPTATCIRDVAPTSSELLRALWITVMTLTSIAVTLLLLLAGTAVACCYRSI